MISSCEALGFAALARNILMSSSERRLRCVGA